MELTVCHSDHKYHLQGLLIVSLSNEESVIVSAFFSVHVSRKHGKIKKVSVLTRLPHSLGP